MLGFGVRVVVSVGFARLVCGAMLIYWASASPALWWNILSAQKPMAISCHTVFSKIWINLCRITPQKQTPLFLLSLCLSLHSLKPLSLSHILTHILSNTHTGLHPYAHISVTLLSEFCKPSHWLLQYPPLSVCLFTRAQKSALSSSLLCHKDVHKHLLTAHSLFPPLFTGEVWSVLADTGHRDLRPHPGHSAGHSGAGHLLCQDLRSVQGNMTRAPKRNWVTGVLIFWNIYAYKSVGVHWILCLCHSLYMSVSLPVFMTQHEKQQHKDRFVFQLFMKYGS